MKGTILFTLLSILSFPLFSQKGYELGVLAGASWYVGDLNPSYGLKTPEPTLQFLGRYNFNSRTSLRLDIAAGRLAGRDSLSENPFQQARNLSFRSEYLESSVNLEFNFFNYIHGSQNQYFTPYIFGGFGFVYNIPRAKFKDEWYGLRDMGTEGQRIGDEYSRIAPMLSYGMGFKMDFNYEWSLNVELSARQMFSDYLDDVSTIYPNMAELELNRGVVAVALSDRSAERGIEPIGQQGRQRGVSGDKDSYYSIRIGVVYYIGMLLCPEINRHQ